jgi:Bacterial SNF2 helicase associated
MKVLAGKAVYLMANDGYPAHKPVNVLTEKAAIRFHFDRREQGTLYYPKIFLGGKEIKFKDTYAEVLCEDPGWMIVDQEAFTFEQPVDGRKLAPFLKKGSMVIRPEMEERFFEGFGKKLIEQYEVQAEGMTIMHQQAPPHFKLYVESSSNAFSMNFKVNYGIEEEFVPSGLKPSEVVSPKGRRFAFFKVARDMAQETAKIKLLESLMPKHRLEDMHFFGKQDGLAWLGEHVAQLKAEGIEVVQTGGDKPINFELPKIILEPQDSGDWFDIKAVVHIGGHEIPFFKFKNHILKGRRDFLLPDGSVVILPESWFSDYRHLVEIAEEREGDIIAIKKYQAVVLEMPNGSATLLKEKLGALIATQRVAEIEPPAGLKAELRAYQKKGYEWLGFLRDSSLGGAEPAPP